MPVNLEISEKHMFGEYLPSVNIERVYLKPYTPDDADFDGISLTAALQPRISISATRPDALDIDPGGTATWSVDQFFKNNLDELNLYVVVNPVKEYNDKILNSNLKLSDIFEANESGFDTLVPEVKITLEKEIRRVLYQKFWQDNWEDIFEKYLASLREVSPAADDPDGDYSSAPGLYTDSYIVYVPMIPDPTDELGYVGATSFAAAVGAADVFGATVGSALGGSSAGEVGGLMTFLPIIFELMGAAMGVEVDMAELEAAGIAGGGLVTVLGSMGFGDSSFLESGAMSWVPFERSLFTGETATAGGTAAEIEAAAAYEADNPDLFNLNIATPANPEDIWNQVEGHFTVINLDGDSARANAIADWMETVFRYMFTEPTRVPAGTLQAFVGVSGQNMDSLGYKYMEAALNRPHLLNPTTYTFTENFDDAGMSTGVTMTESDSSWDDPDSDHLGYAFGRELTDESVDRDASIEEISYHEATSGYIYGGNATLADISAISSALVGQSYGYSSWESFTKAAAQLVDVSGFGRASSWMILGDSSIGSADDFRSGTGILDFGGGRDSAGDSIGTGIWSSNSVFSSRTPLVQALRLWSGHDVESTDAEHLSFEAYYESWANSARGRAAVEEYLKPKIWSSKLVDLLDDAVGYSDPEAISGTITPTVVDPGYSASEGKSIVEIRDIMPEITFSGAEWGIWSKIFDNSYLMAFVGRESKREIDDDLSRTTDILSRYSDSTGHIDPESSIPHPGKISFFENYYGDISYEHVMNYYETPPWPTIDVYRDANGSPYSGLPISSFDGRYWSNSPIGQAEIIEAITQLSAKYISIAEVDPPLQKNLNNLYVLMDRYRELPALLPELQRYRLTYMDKSPASNSGQLLKELTEAISSANSSVIEQTQLFKKQIINDKIRNLRTVTDSVEHYKWPSPTQASLTWPTGTPIPTEPSSGLGVLKNDYIPIKSVLMSRNTMLTRPSPGLVSDFFEFVTEEVNLGDALIWTGFEESDIDSAVASLGTERDGVSTEGYSWGAAGVLREAMTDGYAAAIEAFKDRQTSGVWMGLGLGSMGLHDATSTRDVWSDTWYGDTVCRNKGVWFFDYEKAISLNSIAANVINLRALDNILGIKMPYEFFKVAQAWQYRREMELKTNVDWYSFVTSIDSSIEHGRTADTDYYSGESTFPDYADDAYDFDDSMIAAYYDDYEHYSIYMLCSFDTSKTYPVQKESTYYFHIDNKKYGQPYVYTMDADFMGGSEDYIDATESHSWTDGAADTVLSDLGIESYKWDSPPWSGGGDEDTMVYSGSPATNTDPHLVSIVDAIRAGAGGVAPEVAALVTAADALDTTNREYSYLKFVNYDFPNSALLGPSLQNSLRNIRTKNNIGTPDKTYRIMAFEFQDFMDDDVAYYNTYGRADFGGYGTGHYTAYYFYINCYDFSSRFIDLLYKTLWWEFDHFIKNYYDLAIETCSYNNIDGKFNTFFAEQIQKKYAVESDGTDTYATAQAWIRAPIVYEKWRQVLFETFGTIRYDLSLEGHKAQLATIKANIVESAANITNNISPETGNLGALKAFRNNFEKLLAMFKPASDYREKGYTSHPIYSRLMNVKGIDYDSIYDEARMTEDEYDSIMGYVHSRDRRTYSNGMYIQNQIFGDLSLSAPWSDDYNPFRSI